MNGRSTLRKALPELILTFFSALHSDHCVYWLVARKRLKYWRRLPSNTNPFVLLNTSSSTWRLSMWAPTRNTSFEIVGRKRCRRWYGGCSQIAFREWSSCSVANRHFRMTASPRNIIRMPRRATTLSKASLTHQNLELASLKTCLSASLRMTAFHFVSINCPPPSDPRLSFQRQASCCSSDVSGCNVPPISY